VQEARVTTSRLELRVIPPSAAAALPDDRADAERILGCALEPTWPHAALLGILTAQADMRDGAERYAAWAIVDRATARVIGDIGFHGPPDADGLIEVGYSVEPAWRRRGIAGEALTALLAWVEREPGVRGVTAGCAPGNAASIRLLEAHGFSPTGEAGGDLRWRR
jgi:ribosomal-protein-alanine N-acetyltransferase